MNESKQILDICVKKAVELFNVIDDLKQHQCNNKFANCAINEQIIHIEKEIDVLKNIMEETQNYITLLS
jgi:hypothetical protein